MHRKKNTEEMLQRPLSGPKKDTMKFSQTPEAIPGPYEKYINSLVSQWPHLRIVEDFMSMNLKHTPTPLQSRIFKTNVRVIDVATETLPLTNSTPTSTVEYKFKDIDGFEQFLNEPRPDSVIARLFLIEDLSAKIIETLGGVFTLDPEFFAQHLNSWWRYYQGYSAPYSSKAGYVPHPLPSSTLRQDFHQFQFRRAYHWPGNPEMEAMRRDYSNLWRPYIPRGIYGTEVFLEEVVTTTSFGAEDLWTGIYLFDPVLPIRPPSLYRGIRNFRQRPAYIGKSEKPDISEELRMPIPKEIAKERSQEHPQFWTSLRDEAASHILELSSHQLQKTRANVKNRPISPVVSKNNHTEAPLTNSSQIPYHPPTVPPPIPAAILKFKAMHDFQSQDSNNLSVTKGEVVIVTKKEDHGWWLVRKMNSSKEGWVPSAYLQYYPICTWSLSNNTPLELPLRAIMSNWALVADILDRRMYHLEDQVARDAWSSTTTQSDLLIQSLKLRKHAIRFQGKLEHTIFVLENRLKDAPYTREFKQDALNLISSFGKIVSRADSNIPTFLAKNSVEEAQKTFVQAEAMKRLTMLAFVFVPISSIATVLSIQDSKPWIKYWIFAGLTIPILILIFSLSREFRGLRFTYLKWGQETLALRGAKKNTGIE